MTRKEQATIAGKISGQKAKEKALVSYYENPTRCKNCGDVIHPQGHERPSIARKKKFCNSSCAAQYNNRLYPKRTAVDCGKCKDCGKDIQFKKRGDRVGGYYRKDYCDECKRNHFRRATSKSRILIEEKTKAEVFKDAKTTWHARNQITKHARTEYDRSNRPKICEICGYDRHIEVCHLRSVASFPDTSLISEINSLDNLVPLCPTHHWELDNGFLEGLGPDEKALPLQGGIDLV